MLDLKHMAALCAIIEEQSFDKAARKLHVTQSAVSQRLKQLEESLGQLLVVRGNPLRATDAGHLVIKHYRQISMLQTELMEDLTTGTQSGYNTVAIGLNADSLDTWFLDALDPLLREQNLLLDLKIDDQDQTHQLLRNGDVLGCISASPEPMQGCSCIPLGVTPYRCLASPDYVNRYFPDGVSSDGFRLAPVAEFNHKDELQNRYLATYFDISPGDYPKHRVPATVPFFDLIIRGHACGMVPDQQSHKQMAEGLVVDMTPGKYLAVPLYWHVWNLKSQQASQITEALTAAAKTMLDPFEAHQDLIHPQ